MNNFRTVAIPGLVDKNGKQRNKKIPTHWHTRELVELGEGQFMWPCPETDTSVYLDTDLRDKDYYVLSVETFDGELLHSENIEQTHRSIWWMMLDVLNHYSILFPDGYFHGGGDL